jgi:hypothetical protein
MSELDKIDLGRCDIGSRWSQDEIWWLAMIIGFTNVEETLLKRNRINSVKGITQILRFEFE